MTAPKDAPLNDSANAPATPDAQNCREFSIPCNLAAPRKSKRSHKNAGLRMRPRRLLADFDQTEDQPAHIDDEHDT